MSDRVSAIQGFLMVSNFCKGFIFAFSHESRAIREIKATEVSLPMCTASESHWFQSGYPNSNITCQDVCFGSYCSVQLGNRSATYKHR